MKIHPCPFCGEADQLEVVNQQRKDLAFSKTGRRRHSAILQDAVECYGCGATGPLSFVMPGENQSLNVEYEQQSRMAAVLAWNARAATSTKAFELVASIIDASLAATTNQSAGKEKL